MPSKSKANKNPPNQHDKRHENGLAPPGKRVTRQRSNNQLNGQANGRATAPTAVTPPALPSTGLNSGFKFPKHADTSATATTSSSAVANNNPNHHAANSSRTTSSPAALSTTARTTGFSAHASTNGNNITAAREVPAAAMDGQARDRTSSDASVDEIGPMGEGIDSLYDQMPMLPSEAALSAAYRQSAMPMAGAPVTLRSVASVSTVLASYPLRDAIAILILLLSLPTSLVVVVQFLFASLTFVPPTAGLTLSTLPNFKEMFNSSNVGYPAMATLVFVDLIFWVLWLPLWRPLQMISLDLAQAVIAISLSGAAASSPGPTYSIATCAVAVCMVHVLRYRAIHLTALDYLRSVIHKLDIAFEFDVPSFVTPFYSSPSASTERGWLFTIIRTVLGIHIFAQGVTTCIRRTLVKANEKESVHTSVPRSDAVENVAGTPESTSRAGSGATDAVQQPHTAATTDGRSPGPSPAVRDRATRESTHRKKRKQANQVRSQQPLWAAIASTKVTFVKEMEQRDATEDAREAAAMDQHTHHSQNLTNTTSSSTPLGAAAALSTPILSFPGSSGTANATNTSHIWICDVRDTEIAFRVELPQEVAANDGAESVANAESLPAGIDRSNPFFVRINSAIWSSTRIEPQDFPATSSKRKAARSFIGEIFGLAPLSSYHCEIVSISTMQVLCAVRLITQATPSAEQAQAIQPAPAQHQPLRPSSPRTTLKQSIQSAEAKLQETRARAKKSKRDQRAAHGHIRNEISKLRGQMENLAATDEKHERRFLQLSQHKNQAEEAITEFKAQADALGDIPADETARYEATKTAWMASLATKKAAAQELDAAKAATERELAGLRTELNAAAERREKLAAKMTQRAQELEKLLAKQQADLSAKQKRELDRAKTYQFREAKETEIRYLIASLDADAQTHSRKAQEAWQEISALSTWSGHNGPGGAVPPSSQAPGYPGPYTASPPTPDGTVNGVHAHGHGHVGVNGFANGAYSTAGAAAPPSSSSSAPFPPTAAPFRPNSAAAGGPQQSRGRSSSMLSQYSGFTESGDDFFAPPPNGTVQQQHTWPLLASGGRKHSDGDSPSSAHATGNPLPPLSHSPPNGSNSPRPDAKPFIPAAAMAALHQQQQQPSFPQHASQNSPAQQDRHATLAQPQSPTSSAGARSPPVVVAGANANAVNGFHANGNGNGHGNVNGNGSGGRNGHGNGR